MTNIRVDWKVFECNFSQSPRQAFESLSYALFCYEMGKPCGIFRYYNQPYIETNTVLAPDGIVTGFQAKYYDAGTTISSRANELKAAIKGAKEKYPDISRILFYINKEMSASTSPNRIKPKYQSDIEEYAQNFDIIIEWRVPSNIEQILLDYPHIRDLYFNPQPGLSKFMEVIQGRTASLLTSIQSEIPYSGRTIKICHNIQLLREFLDSKLPACVIYGDAGTGKSGMAKDLIQEMSLESSHPTFLAFSATDFDVEEEALFLKKYGEYQIDDIFNLCNPTEIKVCVIESAEKFFTLNYQSTFNQIIQKFLKKDWKVIFTIRTAYKDSFCNLILTETEFSEVCVTSIEEKELVNLGEQYNFQLPEDKNLLRLLCNLFHLNLFLKLPSRSSSTISTTESFMEQVWRKMVCNDTHRAGNLPVRRGQLITNIIFSMFAQGISYYESTVSDDYEALQGLESSSIITPYDDSGHCWMISHDVYEEIIVKHILADRYRKNIGPNEFVNGFGTSLRARKLYRIWLEGLLTQDDDHSLDFFISIMESSLGQEWKDETLIALMQSGNYNAFCILGSIMNREEYKEFPHSVFILNTACRETDKKLLQKMPELNRLSTTVINKFRITRPAGSAWHTIFQYIYDNLALIPWSHQNLDVVLSALKSWTEKYESGQTTKIAGKIALYLKNKLWNNCKHLYSVHADSHFAVLNDIILASSIELKQELTTIFNSMISSNAWDNRNEDDLLLQKSLSNIFNCGKAFKAVPLVIINLAESYWCSSYQGSDVYDYYPRCKDIEYDFGLNLDTQIKYEPESAYQTPLYLLLREEPFETLKFILRLMNYTTECYKNSKLGADANEIFEIYIKMPNEESIKQLCSDRLWNMHRGTTVAPKLLESALMALEKWLLEFIQSVDQRLAVEYCKYLIKNSTTASITAVVLSAVIAYPDKLFDISCILVKTKEIFICDNLRLHSEHNTNFLKGTLASHRLYDKERIESNNLSFRKRNFEDILISYQSKSKNMSEEFYRQRLKQLYSAFDEATVGIESWNYNFQYAYYRIDLRRYQVSDVQDTKDGLLLALETKMPQNLVEYSNVNKANRESLLRHTNLLLWSDAKLKRDREAMKKYPEFADDPDLVIREVKEILEEDNTPRFFSMEVAINACSVLLRDERELMTEEQVELSINVVMQACLAAVDQNDFCQSGDGMKAAIPTLVMLASCNNLSPDWMNPLFLLLALVMQDGQEKEIALESISKTLWISDKKAAWKLMRAYAELAPQYHKVVHHYGSNISSKQFFEDNQVRVAELFQEDVTEFDAIPTENLDTEYLIDLQLMISPEDNAIFTSVLKNGNTIWKHLFCGHSDRQHNYRSEFEYIDWLSDYVLNLSENEQTIFTEQLMKSVVFDRGFSRLLRGVIISEDRNPRYQAFWGFWNQLKKYIFSSCKSASNQQQLWEGNVLIDYGLSAVLVDYLLACNNWRENVKSWHSLRQENAIFFQTAANEIGARTEVLYAISRVLNGIGAEVFFEDGAKWLSSVIRRNPHLRETALPMNTIYYIEEYIFRYVERFSYLFKKGERAGHKREVLDILNFLVDRGSTSGFLLREEIT